MTELLLDPRLARAEQVKQADDVPFPPLKYWNSEACSQHETPQVDCEFRACGGELFSHQRVGVMWLYLRRKGLLADLPGVGKTNQILGLAALLKERGELTHRMLIVCNTPSTLQWFAEAQRWTPRLKTQVIYSGLNRTKRIQRYVQDFDMLIIGNHMMLQDMDILEKLEFETLIVDDVDALLNHETKTHQAIVSLSQNVKRSVVMNATAIQTKLQQVHAALMPAGGIDVFGPLSNFERRHVRKETERRIGPSGRVSQHKVDAGYKNGEELRQKLGPMYLRRRYEDLSDVRMPVLMPPKHVWLEMHPAQRKKYEELKEGVLRLKKDGVEKVKHAEALAKFTYGQQICAGLPALGEDDGAQASVKLDWLTHQVMEAWPDRKVVAFIKNIGLVAAAEQRLLNRGVGVAKIWGKTPSAAARAQEISRFWNDPECRVLLGTSSIERSLNLQNANILVNVDTMLNPSRMQQLAGRVRRAGSVHQHIWVFNLFVQDSQETRYLDILEKRQAVADFTWGETNELYASLSPSELLSLISP